MDIKNFIMNIEKDVENSVIDGYKCEIVDAVYNEIVEAFIASKSSYVVSSKDIEGDYEALAIVESLDEAFDIIKNDSAGYSKYYCVEQNLTGNKVFYEVKDSKTNSQGVFDYYSEVRDLDDGYKLCLRDRTVNSVFTVD